jgi:hypothetical protein
MSSCKKCGQQLDEYNICSACQTFQPETKKDVLKKILFWIIGWGVAIIIAAFVFAPIAIGLPVGSGLVEFLLSKLF